MQSNSNPPFLITMVFGPACAYLNYSYRIPVNSYQQMIYHPPRLEQMKKEQQIFHHFHFQPQHFVQVQSKTPKLVPIYS